MSVGGYMSGGLHAGLIGWLALGGGFAPAPPEDPEPVQEVSVITAEDFAILSNVTPPDVETVSASVAPVVTPDTPPDMTAQTDPVPETPQAPPPTTPAAQDPLPETLPEPPVAPVQPVVTPPAPPPQSPVIEVAQTPPSPAASPRVAPRVAPPPAPDAQIDDNVQIETRPDENAPTVAPEQQATAPEQASTQIVTEPEAALAAPGQSLRPQLRPASFAPAPAAPQESQEPAVDPLAAALAEAAATELPAAPLTAAEAQGLQFAISSCWNVGFLSTDALSTVITVGFELDKNARPITSSIELIAQQSGTALGASQAFDAARQAILECGAAGYALPVEKYEHWRYINMTFNPEKMRVK